MTPRHTPRAPRHTAQETPRQTPRTAVIYTRVSSREQEQEGYSLDAQSKLLRDFAERNNLEIVQAFEDVETAKTTGRKQFGEMVATSWKSKRISSKRAKSYPRMQNRKSNSCTIFAWPSRAIIRRTCAKK